MKIFCRFDNHGFPVEFYNDVDHKNIPFDAVEISAEDWQGYLTGKFVRAPNGKRIPRTLTIEELRARKLQELAQQRYMIETAGITFAGEKVRTDRQSQGMLTAAWVSAQQNPGAKIDWKGPAGWQLVDKGTIEAMSSAVGAHVQACFSAERLHAEKISNLKTSGEINNYNIATGWPEVA